MVEYSNISVKKGTWRELHETFLPHETWDDRLNRAIQAEEELARIKGRKLLEVKARA
jgi:hypothetical protein